MWQLALTNYLVPGTIVPMRDLCLTKLASNDTMFSSERRLTLQLNCSKLVIETRGVETIEHAG